MTFLLLCSEQILEQKKRALQAKEALEQEHLRNVEADKQAREAERNQAKARRIAEAQRAQQRAALDLQQKTNYFQVTPLHASILCSSQSIHLDADKAMYDFAMTASCKASSTKVGMPYGSEPSLSTAAAYHHQALLQVLSA